MEIDEQIKQINDEIQRLRGKRIELIQKYLEPFAKQAIYDIRQFKIDCGYNFDIDTYYFDKEDEVYVIRLLIDDREFKSRLKKKHEILGIAHKNISNDFALRKIMIMGANYY